MTASPQQRSLFDLITPTHASGARPARPAPAARSGRHPVAAAQHQGEPETLDERFERWIKANPQVLEAFIRRAEQYRAQGYTRLGAKHITEDMRSDRSLWTDGDPFKINNLFVSRLARLAVAERPYLAQFFEFRELQS